MQKARIWAWDDLGWFSLSKGFGVLGWSYSNFLASTVGGIEREGRKGRGRGER